MLVLRSNSNAIPKILLMVYLLVSLAESRMDKKIVVQDGDTLVCRKRYDAEEHLRASYCEKNGEYHGKCETWHPNGELETIGKYEKGVLIDTFWAFFSDGSLEGMTAPQGRHFTLDHNGDTLRVGLKSEGQSVGLFRSYYSANRPKRFTNFNDNGDKHGWEIFWYDNGNVKDSILFRNDSTMQRRSYYYNGKPQMFEDDIYRTYDAVSFNPKGKRTGKIKDGTGTVFLCDSVGGDCKELKYKDGKRVLE